jgi:hypothetical protein
MTMSSRIIGTIAALLMGSMAAFGQEPAALAVAPTGLPGDAVVSDTPDASGFYTLPEPPRPDVALIGAAPATNGNTKDLQKFDEPKDVIAQHSSSVMSKYIVRADRVPEFRIRDVYTMKGLEDIGFRDHPGLRVGNFFKDNVPQAYEIFLEDDRLANIKDLTDTALAMTVGGDKAEGDAILRAERQAYNREERTDPLQSWEDIPHNRDGTPLVLNLEQVRATFINVRF